jgi:hypothetical protein
MNAAALLLLAGIAHLAPEHMATLLGHSVKAWELVARGVEGLALWALVGSLMRSWPVWLVAGYCMLESAQMAVCRLAQPMDKAPILKAGEDLCTAAGWGVGYFSPVVLSAIAFAVAVKTTTCKD